MQKAVSTKNLKYLALFTLSLLIVIFSFYFREELSHLGSLGLIGIFLVNILGSATIFFPAPAIATVFAGGVLYNPLLVALVAGLGSAIGDFISYILGKSGKEIFFKKDSFWYGIFKDVFHKYGAIFIIVFSFIPNPVFDAIGIFAGIFSYSPRRFFLYIFIGRFLRNLLLAGLGSTF